jgi:hypothetical protein
MDTCVEVTRGTGVGRYEVGGKCTVAGSEDVEARGGGTVKPPHVL